MSDILLLGLKGKVTAVSKIDGSILWCTELKGGVFSSGGFVTLISDGKYVFAYSTGQLHCLDLATGEPQWANDLPGYGYGLGSLCLPGQGSAPDMATLKYLEEQQQSSSSDSVTTSSSH